MKTKQILPVVPVMFALLTGCTWDAPSSPIWPLGGNRIFATAATNGDIVQELVALDKTEIEFAKLGKMKAHNPKVKHYAEALRSQHVRCLHKVEHFSRHTGIAPVMNPVATNLENHGQQELARLRSLNGAAFDRAFIIDAINDHQTAIDLVDQALLQSTDARLTKFLKATRHHLAAHLHRAEMIQKELALY